MEDPFRIPTAKLGEPDPEQTAPSPQPTTPNHIPESERWWNGFLSLLLLGYGAYGLSVDDIYIPGKRGNGTHFHGIAACIVFSAMVTAAANLISVIVDHYDRRNNETNYRLFSRVTQGIGIALFFAAMFVQCSSK
jgi:NADPH-dependent 2,4-dienoyl-CoA reductase/sulfur reductase-like enzyme